LHYPDSIPSDEAPIQVIEPVPKQPPENPLWNFLDVLLIAGFGFAAQIVLVELTIGIAHSFSRFHGLNMIEMSKQVVLLIPAETAGYLLLLVFMLRIVKGKYGAPNFLEAVQWNPPDLYKGLVALGGGAVLGLAIPLVSHFLDRWIPKSLPINDLFRDTKSAYMISLFGIFVAPFVEELFFRGFLYPALARKTGVTLAIILTAAPFALVHEGQLAHAWIPLALLFIVGAVLTYVRARTKSVATTVLMHMGYNSVIFFFVFIGTEGFRHMERL
jgi:CAAX protease family protein